MLGKPVREQSPHSEESDEFDAGSDNDNDGGVNMPVSKFQSKFLDNVTKPIVKLNINENKDIVDELLNLPDERIFLIEINA